MTIEEFMALEMYDTSYLEPVMLAFILKPEMIPHELYIEVLWEEY